MIKEWEPTTNVKYHIRYEIQTAIRANKYKFRLFNNIDDAINDIIRTVTETDTSKMEITTTVLFGGQKDDKRVGTDY